MKGYFFKLYYVAVLLVVILNMGFSILDIYSVNIEDLPQGKLIFITASPDGTVELRVYQIDCSIGTAVRVESVIKQKNTKRNIYWNTGITNAEIVWYSGRSAYVNGILLDVIEGEVYDCRRGRSIFLAGSPEK